MRVLTFTRTSNVMKHRTKTGDNPANQRRALLPPKPTAAMHSSTGRTSEEQANRAKGIEGARKGQVRYNHFKISRALVRDYLLRERPGGQCSGAIWRAVQPIHFLYIMILTLKKLRRRTRYGGKSLWHSLGSQRRRKWSSTGPRRAGQCK